MSLAEELSLVEWGDSSVGQFLAKTNRSGQVLVWSSGEIVDDEVNIRALCGDLDNISLSERVFWVRIFEMKSSQSQKFGLGQTLKDIFGASAIFFDSGNNRILEAGPLSSQATALFTQFQPLVVLFDDDNPISFKASIYDPLKGKDPIPYQSRMDVPIEDLESDGYYLTLNRASEIASELFGTYAPEGYEVIFKRRFPIPLLSLGDKLIGCQLKANHTIRFQPLSSDSREEFLVYQGVAGHADVSYLSEIAKLIQFLQAKFHEKHNALDLAGIDMSVPFISVLGPSGCGKTQLAYSLDRSGVPTIHLLMKSDFENVQEIYKVSENLSVSFSKQISLDRGILKEYLEQQTDMAKKNLNDDNVLTPALIALVRSCNFLKKIKDRPLYCIGFLDLILRLKLSKDILDMVPVVWDDLIVNGQRSFSFDPMSAVDFYNEWKNEPLLPVICLDEFNLSMARKVGLDLVFPLLYSRNLIRGLSLPCMTFATNSAASNLSEPLLIGNDVDSYSPPVPDLPWAYVIYLHSVVDVRSVPGFEKYKTASMNLQFRGDDWQRLFYWIEYGLTTLIPRFLRIGLNALTLYLTKDEYPKSPYEGFKQMLKGIFQETQKQKYHLDTANPEVSSPRNLKWGIIGQISHLYFRSNNSFWSKLIHTSFAHILNPNLWTIANHNEADADPATSDVPVPLDFASFENLNWCFPLFRVKRENDRVRLVTKKGLKWGQCQSHFKSPNVDQLAALALLSHADDERGFFVDHSVTPYKAYFKYFLRECFRGGHIERSPFSRFATKGHIWEDFVRLVLILASMASKDKLFGTSYPEFCLTVAKYLNRNFSELNGLSESCDLKSYFDILSKKPDCPKFPMLGPVNDSFDFLKKVFPDAQLGSLKFTRNQEQVDGRVEPAGIVCLDAENKMDVVESKNTKGGQNAALGEILAKAEASDPNYSMRILQLFSMDFEYNPNWAPKRFTLKSNQLLFISEVDESNNLRYRGFVGQTGKGSLDYSKLPADFDFTVITTVGIVNCMHRNYGTSYSIGVDDYGQADVPPGTAATQPKVNKVPRAPTTASGQPAPKRTRDSSAASRGRGSSRTSAPSQARRSSTRTSGSRHPVTVLTATRGRGRATARVRGRGTSCPVTSSSRSRPAQQEWAATTASTIPQTRSRGTGGPSKRKKIV